LRDAVGKLHARAAAVAPTFNGQDVANTLHACAKLAAAPSHAANKPPDALVASLAARAGSADVLPTLRAKELVNVLWACSTLKAPLPITVHAALLQVLCKRGGGGGEYAAAEVREQMVKRTST
jgi:hypothetical protein